MEYIIFNTAGEEFGLSVHSIREVVKATTVHHLPQSPDFVEGVMTLRGHSVAVIDLEKKLHTHRDVRRSSPSAHVLVVRVEKMILGLKVDKVIEIRDIPESQIDITNKVVNSLLEVTSVLGMAHLEDRMIVLLNPSFLLTGKEKVQMQGLGT